MSLDDNFDLVLAIPCDTIKTKKKKSIDSIASTSLAKFSDSPVKCGDTEFKIKNVLYDNKANIEAYSKIFCEQIKEHGDYELIFSDENSTIKTVRTPLLFGQVILYEDEKNDKFNPLCCYNFFCVLGELTIEDDV
ncbi:hypothetical protein AGMMS49991_08510 [Spirochaetia bacterium]|nr:hypothetical protein AGMMS49991_08510 [Spirochaetia bacterium]